MSHHPVDIAFIDPACPRDLPGTPVQQSATYAAVLASFGCTTALAEIRSASEICGRARIYLRGAGPVRLAWLPRGPIWTAGTPAFRVEAAAALPRAAPFRALWASSGEDGKRGWPVTRAAQIADWPLNADEATARAALQGKWRNRLTSAETAGLDVTLRPLDPACDASLLEKEIAQRRNRRYAALPAAFTARWATLAPKDSLMVIAKHKGGPVAFMLMLLHGTSATYHIGWTSAEGRARHAHNLLLWRASRALAARGVRQIDLGQLDPARSPGIAHFKLGTGAIPKSIPATRLHI